MVMNHVTSREAGPITALRAIGLSSNRVAVEGNARVTSVALCLSESHMSAHFLVLCQDRTSQYYRELNEILTYKLELC